MNKILIACLCFMGSIYDCNAQNMSLGSMGITLSDIIVGVECADSVLPKDVEVFVVSKNDNSFMNGVFYHLRDTITIYNYKEINDLVEVKTKGNTWIFSGLLKTNFDVVARASGYSTVMESITISRGDKKKIKLKLLQHDGIDNEGLRLAEKYKGYWTSKRFWQEAKKDPAMKAAREKAMREHGEL